MNAGNQSTVKLHSKKICGLNLSWAMFLLRLSVLSLGLPHSPKTFQVKRVLDIKYFKNISKKGCHVWMEEEPKSLWGLYLFMCISAPQKHSMTSISNEIVQVLMGSDNTTHLTARN